MSRCVAKILLSASLVAAPFLSAAQAGPPDSSSPPINLNTAKPSELKQLGLSNRQVERLIWERSESGGFKDLNDLMKRPKIGQDLTKALKPRCEEVIICYRPKPKPKPKPRCEKPPCFT